MEKTRKILKEIGSSQFVYRKFLSLDEIKICNKLVKEDYLYKSKPDEKNATIAYFITSKGCEWLEHESLNNPITKQNEQLFCSMKGKGFCPYEYENGKCKMDSKCTNHVTA